MNSIMLCVHFVTTLCIVGTICQRTDTDTTPRGEVAQNIQVIYNSEQDEPTQTQQTAQTQQPARPQQTAQAPKPAQTQQTVRPQQPSQTQQTAQTPKPAQTQQTVRPQQQSQTPQPLQTQKPSQTFQGIQQGKLANSVSFSQTSKTLPDGKCQTTTTTTQNGVTKTTVSPCLTRPKYPFRTRIDNRPLRSPSSSPRFIVSGEVYPFGSPFQREDSSAFIQGTPIKNSEQMNYMTQNLNKLYTLTDKLPDGTCVKRTFITQNGISQFYDQPIDCAEMTQEGRRNN